KKAGTTILQATPTLWNTLLASDVEHIRGLKMLVGGEALSGGLSFALRRLGGRLTNLYGPTETTIWSTAMSIREEGVSSPSIGQPLWNTRPYVLDGTPQPVPIGAPG